MDTTIKKKQNIVSFRIHFVFLDSGIHTQGVHIPDELISSHMSVTINVVLLMFPTK